MSKNFRISLNEQLKNKEFKEEWNKLESEFNFIKTLISIRNEKNITQKKLSELTGITQSDISKIENGNANPSIKTLKRIATALGCELKLNLEPIL